MSNDIVNRDPHLERIRAVTQVKDVGSSISFPAKTTLSSELADTYIIAHYDGEGASTLALLLSHFINPEPLVMEIGTNASRAFKSLPQERRFAPPLGVQSPVRTAMDERVRRPSTPTIVEFGRTYWRDAIDVAEKLQRPPLSATAHFCFLASESDRSLKIPKLAQDRGVRSVIVFGGRKIAQEARPGVIKIPTLPDDMQRLIYSDGLSLRDAANASDDRFSALEFVAEFKAFGSDVQWELAG